LIRHLLTAAAVAALSACASGSGPAQAPADASMGPGSAKVTGYFSSAPLDGKTILGPPPTPDSAYGKADRSVFEETRKLEGSARWKTAIQDNDLWGGGALKRFSCAMGVDINAQQTPATWKILHKIEQDVRTVGTPAKQFYDRKRPLIGNDAPICVPREDWMKTNASYPSGHSMTAWSWGLILAEAAPAKASAVLALAKDSGDSRVVCGVHFQSDVEAGRTLGSAMVARLHDEPEFEADMARAKREMAAAKTPPTGCDA
jgi:acid phosphatase (class A)